ncbi:MAG: hypothetical protein LBE12_14190, partial [Planctomycetaceae bacterium]|nr:hypothetical protein [Planctomycetaceae bacterium]
ESVACGMITVLVVIRLRHYPLSTFHSQLLFCPFRAKTFLNLKNYSPIILIIIRFGRRPSNSP